MQYLTHGWLPWTPAEILESALFREDVREMVIVKDIELYSMWSQPYATVLFGKAHIAYIPNGYINRFEQDSPCGWRFSRRLQVQEKADHTDTGIDQAIPESAGCCRGHWSLSPVHDDAGVSKQNSVTTTSAFTVNWKKWNPGEFMKLISSRLH